MTAKLLSSPQMSQTLQLRQEGYSIRDIAHELSVPKSRIEWFLKAQKQAVVPVVPAPLEKPTPETDLTGREEPLLQQQTDLDTQRQELQARATLLAQQEQQLLSRSSSYAVTTREHARQLEELAQREQALIGERIALEDRTAQLHRLLQAMPQQEEQYETFRKRARQQKLVNRYNRLLQDVLDNCDDCRWSGDEVDDLLERAEAIKDKVVAYCEANHIDERRLLIYQGLLFLISDIEDEQRDQTSGLFASSSVDFDFGPDHQAKYKSYLVTDFDQVAALLHEPVEETTSTTPVSIDEDDDNEWEEDD